MKVTAMIRGNLSLLFFVTAMENPHIFRENHQWTMFNRHVKSRATWDMLRTLGDMILKISGCSRNGNPTGIANMGTAQQNIELSGRWLP